MELRVARDEAKVAAENAEKEYREAEADAFEALEDNPVQGTIKVDLGEPFGVVSFRTRETPFAPLIDSDAAVEYYERRAMLDEVSAPKFVMKRLNEEIRDCIEQGTSPPPGVDWYIRRGVTITRQKD
jgi:hypothetical protein